MATKHALRKGPEGSSPTGEEASLAMIKRGYAGPYLRYINISPDRAEWRGTALLLVRSDRLTSAQAPPGETSPVSARLTWQDGGQSSKTDVDGVVIDKVEGWQAWRFSITLGMGKEERSIRYSIAVGPFSTDTFAFWVPGRDKPLHWGYTSCNGISIDVGPDAPAREDPTYLWRDMLKLHDGYPLHCVYGGGDQVYNDLVWSQPALAAWGSLSERSVKLKKSWTPEMETQATAYYCKNYIDTLSTTTIATAMACIPQIMLWDDHDIWDGYGSYRAEVQACDVFQKLFVVARRFFLLFQKHTTPDLAEKEGEFILPGTYHSLHYLGPTVSLLSLDMRTNRTREQCIAQEEYPMLKQTMLGLPSMAQHLVIGSGIPLVWTSLPKMEWVLRMIENAANKWSCCMGTMKKTGLIDKFDQPEILDDLHDGWMADLHKKERLFLIHLLQEVAEAKKVRISILSGDAHVAGIGRLYSQPKYHNLEHDPLFMPQITSSAIVNSPPPTTVVTVLTRFNFSKSLDHRTREKMVHAFWPAHKRADKLLGARNWCDVTLCAPPFSYPMVSEETEHCALRYVLRVEDAAQRGGFADETFSILVPRLIPDPRKEPPPGMDDKGIAQAREKLQLANVRYPAIFYELAPSAAGSPGLTGEAVAEQLEPHGALSGELSRAN